MSELAEQTDNFEKRYWETQRHLALAPNIGRVALWAELPSDMKLRRYKEITSGLAEAIDGFVKNDCVFEVKNNKVVAEDGDELEKTQRQYLLETIRVADGDVFYAGFWPERAKHELDELLEIQNMAGGNTSFNAILTLSPYTEELAGSKLNNYKLRYANQKPEWQRAMVRLSRWDGQHLHVTTRSLDNSSLELLKLTAKMATGYEYQADSSTEMLGERIYLVTENNQIVDDLVNCADQILHSKHGGRWHQGRQENTFDSQNFVQSQTDIIEDFFRVDHELVLAYQDYESYRKAFYEHLYNYSALLENRLLTGETNDTVQNVTAAAAASGNIARAEGKVYDMCGLVLTANGHPVNNAAKTGFESLQRLIGQKVECPACKNKVVVPQSKLQKGILCCKECKLEVDVCTGAVVRKPKIKDKHLVKNRPNKETQWQKIVREDNEKKLRRRLEKRRVKNLEKAA